MIVMFLQVIACEKNQELVQMAWFVFYVLFILDLIMILPLVDYIITTSFFL